MSVKGKPPSSIALEKIMENDKRGQQLMAPLVEIFWLRACIRLTQYITVFLCTYFWNGP